MKVLKREESLLYSEVAEDRIKIILSNGSAFYVYEDKTSGRMKINKIADNIFVHPRYANEIEVE